MRFSHNTKFSRREREMDVALETDEAELVDDNNLPEILSLASLLHSTDANNAVYVIFQNGTERFVDVIWVDYIGQWIRYETLPPGDTYEVYTYVSHPWVFLDGDTGIRLQAVGRGKVFFPLMSDCQEEYDTDGVLHLTPVTVTVSVPVFSLKQRCLEVICLLINTREAFSDLNLPREIVSDLQVAYDAPNQYRVLDSSQIETGEEIQEADDEGFNETEDGGETAEDAEGETTQGSDVFDPLDFLNTESELFDQAMISEAVANVIERLHTVGQTETVSSTTPTPATSGTSTVGSTSQTVPPPRPLPRHKIGTDLPSSTDEENIPDEED